MSIGIIGAGSPEKSVELLSLILKDAGYRRNLSKEQYQRIMNRGPFKPIHPALEQFIGTYDVEIVSFPEWYNDFYMNLAQSLVNRIADEDKEFVTEQFLTGKIDKDTDIRAKKLIQIKNKFKELTPKNFYFGKFNDDQKILKFCKGAYVTMNKDLPDDAANQSWYKTFESKKAPNNEGLKIVITNDQSSFMAMSSVFDKPDYSSCQSLHKYEPSSDYIRGLPSNLLDPNSLICYVTSGRMGQVRGKNYFTNHQTMLVRLILRLVKDKSGQLYIVPDRAYPHKTYTMSVFRVLQDICKASGWEVRVGKHSSYSQESSTSSAKVNFTTDESNIRVELAQPGEFSIMNRGDVRSIWGDEVDAEGESCRHSSRPNECKFKGENKFNCGSCMYNNAERKAPYHDNMTDGPSAVSGAYNSYNMKGVIDRIAESW